MFKAENVTIKEIDDRIRKEEKFGRYNDNLVLSRGNIDLRFDTYGKWYFSSPDFDYEDYYYEGYTTNNDKVIVAGSEALEYAIEHMDKEELEYIRHENNPYDINQVIEESYFSADWIKQEADDISVYWAR